MSRTLKYFRYINPKFQFHIIPEKYHIEHQRVQKKLPVPRPGRVTLSVDNGRRAERVAAEDDIYMSQRR